jgi:signal transduction histidine kinase/ActR/RegA family two-component response regulator
MLGYASEEEVLALDITRDVYLDAAELRRLLPEVLSTGRIANLEVQWKRNDGRTITVRLNGRVVPGLQPENPWLEFIAEDVTAQRSLEAQFRQSQKMEAVGRLAGGVAHDFNNLLTVISGYADLILQQLGPEAPLRREMLQINKAAERAALLTRQLLAFSRQQMLEPRVLQLNEVVTGIEPMLRRLLGEDIRLITRLQPALGRVKADPGQMEQVIMNLAVNARDAMPKGGELTVETKETFLDKDFAHDQPTVKPGRYVHLAVADTGVGMDEETLAHIFEPFFTTKERGKGTGLGLSTVYGIVKQSDGYVWAQSKPGKGASFHLYLPLVEIPVAQPGEAEAARTAEKPGSETILVVEDEEGVRSLVRHVLHRQGYNVLEARHAGEALLLCDRFDKTIHLLLTDVILEHVSGPELARRLLKLRPGMRVLFMSGYTDDAVLRHGVQSAETPFLQKPFTTDVLARKVREVLDQPVAVK